MNLQLAMLGRKMPHNYDQAIILARLRDEARRGMPVRVQHRSQTLLAVPVEALEADTYKRLFNGDQKIRPALWVSDRRALALKIAPKGRRAVGISLGTDTSLGSALALADATQDLQSPLRGPFEIEESVDPVLALSLLALARLAGLMPATLAIGADVAAEARSSGVMEVSAETLGNWQAIQSASLREVTRAKVPLAGALDAKLVLFREDLGGGDHLAVIIGDPPLKDPVLTRVHSACLTGDILQSLKCDCGEQLRGAVASIESAGGGLLLYLAQEGRGIGLASKLRAYQLQDQGFDTLEANERLGFQTDERDFALASRIMQHLGYARVRLMTNNPDKVAQMTAAGIDVTERLPLRIDDNTFNATYLDTKRDRAGHDL